ncbi:tail assembly chaperone [Streptococcus pyogenes]|uniref:tail assembly chaperone n=1 Tax=Streptococcus pyogenes TaxID=1314 RepID=UPI000450B7B9|nr:tail assembly chaperone [Streptococcus pyogenes]HER4594086.1 hypothetical protein [Streptococcus pyogenes NGAS616]HER4636094.1 hypothetical protein [Streptococcus pyogenes NGAS510]HER4707585.1 hypothetical protein [Streptococcus pyogenes NGAS325]ARV01475.1 hypothetical protein AYM92_06090 [Streptococcus pyogenes]ASQ21429.1 hypothetical protein B4W66_05900 [Streptococcus pyogenes]
MEVTIGKKTYELIFGFKFLKFVNKVRSVTMDGVSTGVGGMTMIEAGGGFKDPEVLEIILKGATNTSSSKPTDDEIEAFIKELIMDGSYIDFYNEVMAEVKKDVILRQAIAGNQKIEAVAKAK